MTSPFLHEALGVLNSTYVRESKLTDWNIRNSFLNSEAQRVDESVQAAIATAFAMALLSDGWCGCQKEHELNLLLATPTVFFLENTILYGEKGEVPEEEYTIPLGQADVKREGKDLTIVTYGRPVIQSLAVAELLAKEHDISVEIVDLRTIRPLDIDTVLASVRKTHRVLIVEEQKPFCGVGAQLTYMIQAEAFDELDAPIARLCTIDAPAIYSPPVEAEQLPNPQRILKAALALLD
jgi:hypothetical protein